MLVACANPRFEYSLMTAFDHEFLATDETLYSVMPDGPHAGLVGLVAPTVNMSLSEKRRLSRC